MKHRLLVLSNDVVFRKVKNEVITIDTKTGEFHYFSAPTESFLAFFNRVATLEDYFASAGLNDVTESCATEQKHVVEFLDRVLQLGILRESESVPGDAVRERVAYERPAYLRHGERNLEEVSLAFLYP